MKYSIEFSRILRHLTFLLVLFAPLSNAAAQPALSLSSSNPVALMDGQAVDYSLSITNAGPGPTEQTLVLYELIPPYTTFNGATSDGGSVAAESVSCVVGTTPPGALPSSQLQICTVRLPSGGLPAGGTTRLRMNVTPRVSTTSATVVNKVALDPTGRNSAMNPALCNSTGIPAGCAVTPALQVVPTAPLLYLAKTNPPQLASGKVATYGLLVTNRGSKATGATLTVYDQLPGNMAYSGAAVNSMGSIRALGAGCSQVGGTAAGGWNMSFSISLPAGGLPPGASVGFSLNGTPSAVTTGRSLDNVAAIDSAGGNAILTPRNRCIATDNPIGCAITDPLVVDGRPAVTLGMSLSAPASLVLGTPATYSALIQNTGGVFSGTNLVSYVQMPAGFQFSSVAPNANGSVTARAASCTAAGQLLTCTLTLPSGGMQNPNDTVGYSLTLTPQPAALNTSVSLKAAVDPTGANAAVPPATCTADGAPSAGCAVSSVMTVAATPPTQYPPALSLSKSNPAALVEGAPADYSLSITNAGPGPTEQTLVLYELIPPYTTFNGATPDGGSVAAESVSCVVGTTPPGALPSSQLQICTVRLPAGGLPAGGTTRLRMNVTPRVSSVSTTVVNKVALDPTGRNSAMNPALCSSTGIPAGCAVTPELQVIPAAPLLYVSQISPPQLASGNVATYMVLITNRGSKKSGQMLKLYDQFPGNVTYAGATVNGMGSVLALGMGCGVSVGARPPSNTDWTAPILCSIGLQNDGLEPGDSVGFSISFIPSVSSAGRSLNNVIAIDPTGENGGMAPKSRCIATDNPVGCSVSDSLVVDGRPAVTLGMSLSAPVSLVVGTPTTYSALIQNTGGVFSGTNLVSYVQMPAGFQFSSVAPNANGSVTARAASCTAAGHLLTCTLTLPSLGMQNPDGTVGYSLTLTPQPAALNTSVSLKAAVDPTGANAAVLPATCTADGSPSAGCVVSRVVTVTATPTQYPPVLSLRISNPVLFMVGQAADYSLSITNAGPGPTEQTLVLYELIPPYMTLNEAVPDGGGSVAAESVSCAVGTTPPGAPPGSQLQICTVRLPSGGLPAGGTTQLRINVTPRAPSVSTTAVNKVALDPAGRNLVMNPVLCNSTGIPAGCAVTPALEVRVAARLLYLAKFNPPQLVTGKVATYVLVVTNRGSMPTSFSTLSVNEKMPPYMDFMGANLNSMGTIFGFELTCDHREGLMTNGLHILCNIDMPPGRLAPGDSVGISVHVRPTAQATGSRIPNRAAVDSTSENEIVRPALVCIATDNPIGCAVADPLEVDAQSVLTLGMSLSPPASLVFGTPATYSALIQNTGGVFSGTNLVSYVQMPAGFQFSSVAPNANGSVTARAASCTAAGQLLTCTLTLPSGGMQNSNGTVGYSLTLTPQPAALNTSVSLKAEVDPTGANAAVPPATCTADGAPSAGCAVSSVMTVAATPPTQYPPALSLSKSNPAALVEGAPADYSLSITNAGPGPTEQTLVLYELIPPYTTFNGATPDGGSVAAESVSCVVGTTPPGALPSSQLQICTVRLPSGGLPAGGTTRLRINVTPRVSTTSATVVNKVALDPTGRNSAMNPALCNSTGIPAGCAVTPELQVIPAAPLLYVSQISPPQLASGNVATYMVLITNRGSKKSGQMLKLYDQFPGNVTYAGATVNGMGSVLALGMGCGVSVGARPPSNTDWTAPILCSIGLQNDGLEPGDSVGFSISFIPSVSSAGRSLNNVIAIDPTGENGGMAPKSRCIATDNPVGCSVSDSLVGDGRPAVTLGMSLSAPVSLVVGTPTTYSALIQNTGGVFSGTNLVSYVQMPAGFQFSSVAPNANGSVTARAASCTAAGQLLTCA